MIRIRDLSIRKKLILIIMSTSAAAVLFGSLFLYLMIIKQYQHLYRSDLAGLARVVGDNCEAALAFDIPEDAHKVLSSLRARPSINSASIYDIRGQLFAAYSKDHRSDPESTIALEAGHMDEKLPIGFLEIDQEIMLDDNVIGRIRMRDDMRSIHTFRRLAVLFLAVAVITGFILALQIFGMSRIFLLVLIALGVPGNGHIDLVDLQTLLLQPLQCEREGGAPTAVQAIESPTLGIPDDSEKVTADSIACGLHKTQHGVGGNRCIDRIASLLQDF